MREYTEVYGVLRIVSQQTEFEIEIVCTRKHLFYPITSNMSEDQAIALLVNHAPYKVSSNKELLEQLGQQLNELRTYVFDAIRHNVVIDKAFVTAHLSKKFKVRTIGAPHVTENSAVLIPNDSTVTIALELYPVKWRGSELDRCRVSDFLEAS